MWLHKQREYGNILLTYRLHKDTVIAIMMRSWIHDCKRSFTGWRLFDMVSDFLQGDALELYPFIIWLDTVLRKLIDPMKENVFALKKKRQKTMMSWSNHYEHRRELPKNSMSHNDQILVTTPHKTTAVRPPISNLETIQIGRNSLVWIAGEVRMNA